MINNLVVIFDKGGVRDCEDNDILDLTYSSSAAVFKINLLTNKTSRISSKMPSFASLSKQ